MKTGTRKHPLIDWRAVERDYRAGILTNSEIVTKHGCASGSALCNKAKRDRWARDLAPTIARTVEKELLDAALEARPGLKAALSQVDEDSVTQRGKYGNATENNESLVRQNGRLLLQDLTFVATTAHVHTELVQRHRADLRNAAELANGLLAELRVTGLARTQLSALLNAARKAEQLDADEWKGLVRDLRTLTGSGRRAAQLATVVGTLSTLQNLERQAFGLRPFEAPSEEQAGSKPSGRKGVRIEFADVPHRDVAERSATKTERSVNGQSAPLP